MAYPLPTEHERRAPFRWLEQAASLTAWRRLSSYNRRFVDAASACTRVGPSTGRHSIERGCLRASPDQRLPGERTSPIRRSNTPTGARRGQEAPADPNVPSTHWSVRRLDKVRRLCIEGDAATGVPAR